MNWLRNLGIGKKIAGGFGVIVLIMGISSVTSYLEIEKVIEINTRVFELRTPTMMASTHLLNGVNHSLAALRGYMILDADKFKTGRKEAWDEIEANLAKLDKFSRKWINPENVKRLQEMKGVFGEFKQAQQEIEDISGTIDNTPATKILVQDAAPLATVMVAEITNIINMEAKLAATKERKALLGMMADVRGTTARSLASIRAFLLTGDKKFQDAFDVMWTKNIKRFGDLTKNSGLMTSKQKASFKKFSEARAAFKGLPSKMFEIRGGKQWNLANAWLGTKAAPRAGKITKSLKLMLTNQEKLAHADVELAEATEHELELLIEVLALLSVVVAGIVGFFVVRMVTKPVESAASGLKQIAEGDLTQRYEVNSSDELGNMLGDMNQMADSLTEIVTEVVNGTTAISEAASEVSRGNADLSQRTEEQASSLEETASSMEEMTSTVKQNADNAAQANQLAAGARTQAEQGGEVVGKAVTAMAEINSSSKKIADIISVIDEIAFQTNLLALNAAVEAARAGEQGRGFAVVAGEVRSLAGRSAEAAKEIKDLIQDSVEKVDQGSKLVDESGKTLEEIVTSVKKVTDIVSEIAASSQEQSAGIEQVNKAVMQMDEMTQQNAALVEEAAAASESMEQQSQGLLQQISFFTVSGSSSQRSVRPTAVQEAPAERRGANRAFAEPVSSEPQVANESSAPQMKKTGTDDEWAEF